MQSIFTLARLHRAALFFCGCVIVGIFIANWFRVLPSIGMAGIALTGLVYVAVHRRVSSLRFCLIHPDSAVYTYMWL